MFRNSLLPARQHAKNLSRCKCFQKLANDGTTGSTLSAVLKRTLRKEDSAKQKRIVTMKRLLVALTICMGVSVLAQDPQLTSEVKKEAVAIPEDRVAVWTGDVEQAKVEAAKYDLPILLLYTAPSWCGYCRKLDDQLIMQDDFKTYANKNLVLLIADYSDRAEGTKWGEKNKDIIESSPIGGFPHLYLLTSDANRLGSVQFYEPEWKIQDYLDKIEALKNGAALK